MRPGMTKVSSDERRRALVCVEACLCWSGWAKWEKLLEYCILMRVCMLDEEGQKGGVERGHDGEWMDDVCKDVPAKSEIRLKARFESSVKILSKGR